MCTLWKGNSFSQVLLEFFNEGGEPHPFNSLSALPTLGSQSTSRSGFAPLGARTLVANSQLAANILTDSVSRLDGTF